MMARLTNGGTVRVLKSGAIEYRTGDGRVFRVAGNGRTPAESLEMIRRNAWGSDVRFAATEK